MIDTNSLEAAYKNALTAFTKSPYGKLRDMFFPEYLGVKAMKQSSIDSFVSFVNSTKSIINGKDYSGKEIAASYVFNDSNLIINVTPSFKILEIPLQKNVQNYVRCVLDQEIGFKNRFISIDKKGDLTIESTDPSIKSKIRIVKDTDNNFTLITSGFANDLYREYSFNGGKFVAAQHIIPREAINENNIRKVMKVKPPEIKVQDQTINLVNKVLQINTKLTTDDVLPSDSDRYLTRLNGDLNNIRNNFQDYELEITTQYIYDMGGNRTNTLTNMIFRPQDSNKPNVILKLCGKEGNECPTLTIKTSEDKPPQANTKNQL